jgi:hypothetical protein
MNRSRRSAMLGFATLTDGTEERIEPKNKSQGFRMSVCQGSRKRKRDTGSVLEMLESCPKSGQNAP